MKADNLALKAEVSNFNKMLREFKGGLLKTYKPETSGDRSLLPQEEGEIKEECEIPETQQELENRKCFRAGL